MKYAELIASYLPGVVVEQLASDEADAPPSRTVLDESVVLFSDISGFTALSESLSDSHGAEAAVELLRK